MRVLVHFEDHLFLMISGAFLMLSSYRYVHIHSEMVRSTLLPVTIRRQTGQVTKSKLPIFMSILTHSGS